MNTYDILKNFNEYLADHIYDNLSYIEIYDMWNKNSGIIVHDPELASLLLESAEAALSMDAETFVEMVNLDRI